MKPILLLYVPVVHSGYVRLFRKYKNRASALYVFGKRIIDEFTNLHQEIRAVGPQLTVRMLKNLGYFRVIGILSKSTLARLRDSKLVLADEEISRRFVKKYFPRKRNVIYEKVFLRWDETTVKSVGLLKGTGISTRRFDKQMIARAITEGQRSSDWWRRVGAVIVKGKRVILEAHNKHVPSEHVPYIDGDPRDFIEAGKLSHLSTALHAEQTVMVEAARKGLSLSGTAIYLSVFPCPVCAKLIAYSGIKKCYFVSGHASLDGQRVLKAKGVKIIQVKV